MGLGVMLSFVGVRWSRKTTLRKHGSKCGASEAAAAREEER